MEPPALISMGLTSVEAQARLTRHGPNEIRLEERASPFALLLRQFASPLILLLVLACAVSLGLGHWAEAAAIGGILLLNAWVGFYQEYRAEGAVLALREMTAPRATALRDGKPLSVLARTVVPGDLLLIEAGDIIAADGGIREAARLQVNEAVLTGESTPVEKSSGRVFMGTAVVTGTAVVEVDATGMATELGKTAHLITTAESPATPLQVQLAQVGKVLSVLCLLVASVVLILGLIQDRPWLDLVIFSVSLAVAAVPEGMPAIVTVALALAVRRMAARNALVRNLPSVETLGSVSVICTDKTGTLTTGNMRVRELYGDPPSSLLRAAAACCDATLAQEGRQDTGDPTELALLIAAREHGIRKEEIDASHPRTRTEPFDSVRKRMSALRNDGTLYVKGAFESIVPLCSGPEELLRNARSASDDLTSRGLRVLAVATGSGEQEKNLRFRGLVGMADPPRSEARHAIAEARAAGITPIMITGDHPATAAAIARELGLVLEKEIVEGRVYARATPEDKLKLVRAWKNSGAIVAMTGDGVNDAPALREAHIGIAMGRNGTEVTRQSADIVLADDNFATIVAAVREGRGVYRNIRKAIVYLLSGNFAELVLVLGASALGLPPPFLAAHLLWINLVTDSLPALALVADPSSADVMTRPPRDAKERLLGWPEWRRIGLVGTIEAAAIALGILLSTRGSSELNAARGIAFTTLVFSQLWRSFGARSRSRVFWEVGASSNLWLLGVVGLAGVLQLSLHFIPLTQGIFGLSPLRGRDLAVILPVSLIPVTIVELSKIFRRFRK